MCGGGAGQVEETAAEKALAETSLKKWQQYKATFRPMENQFIDEVQGLNSNAVRNQTVHQATAPINSSFGRAITNDINAMASNGFDPSSGKVQSQVNKQIDASTSAYSDTSNRAEETATDRFIGGLSNVIAMGHGQAGNAISGMADVANTAAANEMTRLNNNMREQQNIADAVTSGVGAYVRYNQNQKGD